VSHRELQDILMTMMRMENISETEAVELVNDIFRDLDLNQVTILFPVLFIYCIALLVVSSPPAE
jgi:hypothetical protein